MRIAVFLDRDGVINKEVKHPEISDREGRICGDVLTEEDWVLFDGVQEAVALLKKAGLLTIVVSNQPGYAKGFLDDSVLDMTRALLKRDISPDGIYYCTHHEDYTGSCGCKKPKKGMLLQASKEHGIDIGRSYMVGDRRNDMMAGADCKRCFYVASRKGEDPVESVALLSPGLQKKVTIVKDLHEAAKLIVEDTKQG